MAWVDLGDLYVKKAGDNVTGSIVMANNNLSVAYDADTTYNVGTEIKSLRDSVSRMPQVFCGSIVRTPYKRPDGSLEFVLFTDSEFVSKFGRSFSQQTDYANVMVGDQSANPASATWTCEVGYWFPDKNLLIETTGMLNGAARFNYVVVLGA